MTFKPYPKYKPSGVEWLGNVPVGWARQRLRFGVELNPSKSECSNLARETMVSFLPMEAISENGKIDRKRERPISEVETGYTYFRDGDIVMAKITPCFENGKGALVAGLTNGIGFGTTELIVARSSGKTDGRFVQWLFMSQTFRKLGEGHMYGAGGQKRLPDDFVRNFDMAWPSTNEQSTIAIFLDRETAKIDTLIAKQEAMIDLLNEKRRAVISHAVTKGLDPNVPMKASGVEWLGNVPEHWIVTPTRNVARLESGHTPSRQHPEYWVEAECKIPWFSLADVWQIRGGNVEYVTETKELVSQVGLANSSARLLPKGTVMLSRTASVGYSAIMSVDMATTQDFANWVCGERLLPEFLLYVFRSMQAEFKRLNMGSTHQTIYMPDIRAFRCPLPSVEEQDMIVAHIRTVLAKLDALTEKAQQAITLQKEHRTALIAAAVTGKIDVRGEVIERKAA